ncbi:dTMP kinase, partial [Streptomyces sp. NPDC007070]
PVVPGAADETTVLPPVTGAADETAVLPPVRDELPPVGGAADETAVLPPVRDGGPVPGRGDDPADRVPPGYFRDERPAAARPDGSDDRTRELPQVGADGADRPARRRPRPDWAEETPLDDLPTLADELLGPRGDDEEHDDGWGVDSGADGGDGRRRGGRRR